MATVSNWPLSTGASRFLTPAFLQEELSKHPLSASLHVTGFGYYPRAHGHRMSRAHPEDHLVLYCIAGSGWLETGRTRMNINTGDLVILPAGDPHHYGADDHTPWTLHWAHYAGHACPTLHAMLGVDGVTRLCPKRPAMLNQAFTALQASRNTGYLLPALVEASLGLAHLLSSLATPDHTRTEHPPRHDGLQRARDWMEAHLDEHPGLDHLAALAGLSRWHFITKYRDAYGYPPLQHFQHRKIERACELLDAGTQSIQAIAHGLGYDDPAYFSRQFRKITGMSPRAYRETTRG